MRKLGLCVLVLGLGLIGCDRPAGYVRKGGEWRYDDVAVAAEDRASFRPLNDSFARDDKRGYYRDAVIADSHGPSFEALGEHEARDRLAVYYADTYRKGQEYWAIRHLRVSLVRDADPASYRLLAHGYARDRQRAFFEGQAFVVRDVASFTPLSAQLARDQLRGYYARTEVPGSDGASFAPVDERDDHYLRDRNQVYHARIETDDPQQGPRPVVRVLRGADPQVFRTLSLGYASDDRQVWHEGRAIHGADAASFALLDPPTDLFDAQDRNARYLQGRRVSAMTTAAAAPSTIRPGSRAR